MKSFFSLVGLIVAIAVFASAAAYSALSTNEVQTVPMQSVVWDNAFTFRVPVDCEKGSDYVTHELHGPFSKRLGSVSSWRWYAPNPKTEVERVYISEQAVPVSLLTSTSVLDITMSEPLWGFFDISLGVKRGSMTEKVVPRVHKYHEFFLVKNGQGYVVRVYYMIDLKPEDAYNRFMRLCVESYTP